MKGFIFFSFIFTLWSCSSSRQISYVVNQSQKIDNNSIHKNTALDSFISPYRILLDKKMNDTLSFNPKEIKKEKMESELGNWVADGMKWYVDSIMGRHTDIALCNYGGIRVKALPQGYIQLKHIFELMPFENQLVIVEMDSIELKAMLQKIAEKDGWPVSKGFYMRVNKDNAIVDWNISGQKKNLYRVILSDYISNGGDNMSLLIDNKREELNILIRNALIAYAKHQNNLSAKIEGRIIKEK